MLDNRIVNVIKMSHFLENGVTIILYILMQQKYRLAEPYSNKYSQ